MEGPDADAVREGSSTLARLGAELAECGFSYKVKESRSRQYWEDRIAEFGEYSRRAIRYYNQAHFLMRKADAEAADLFVLRTGRFRQLGLELEGIMRQIRDNPTVMDSDRGQSKWSKGLKKRLTECSDECLRHEKDMNAEFRGFYESKLKDVS